MPTAAARVAIHTGILAGYLLLAALHTYPLVRHLDTHLPGQGLGDNASFVWNAWWMRVALASPHAFFWNPLIEVPVGASLALHTHGALSAFLAATVLAPLPLVRAHNLVLLASLALNGYAAYALAFLVSRARGASLLAGALFLVAPTIAARLMGHYNLVVAWPLVVGCAAVVAWWRRPSLAWAGAVGAAAALTLYADYYYAVFLGLFAIVYSVLARWTVRIERHERAASVSDRVLLGLAALLFAIGLAVAVSAPFQLDLGITRLRVRTADNVLTAAWLLAIVGLLARWRPRPRLTPRQPVPPAALRSLAAAAIVLALIAAPLLAAAWQLWRQGGYVTQTSSLKSSPRGVDVATLLLGPPYSGLAGPAVRRGYQAAGLDLMEASGWIGVVPLVLLGLTVVRARREPDVRRWLLVAACFAVWALGPYLMVLGRNVGLLLPQALAHVVPIVNNARIPGRAMAMVQLAIVVAVAAAWAAGRLRLRPWALAGLGAVAVAESLAAPLPLIALDTPGVYTALAGRPPGGAVLTIPFGVRDGFGEQGLLQHDALYAQTIHGRGLAGGFVARLSPRVWTWYATREPYRTLLTASRPDAPPTPPPACAATLAGLREADVRFVVLYPHQASPALRALTETQLPLVRLADDGRRVLYAVDTGRPCG